MVSTHSLFFLSLALALDVVAQPFDNPTTYQSVNLPAQPLEVGLNDFTTTSTTGTATILSEGLILACPRGTAVQVGAPMIYDTTGNVVWIGPPAICAGPEAQWYNGELILSVWTGVPSLAGYGMGRYNLYDSTYTNILNVTAQAPGGADLHEFHVIPQNGNKTAVLTTYVPIGNIDLTSRGGPSDGWILDSQFQEVDIATGSMLFNWSALEHMNLDESFAGVGITGNASDNPWDFSHVNSIDKGADGHYLVSSRHFHQLLKVNSSDGSVIWRMGGITNNFTIGDGANFEWQHHARWQGNGTSMTVFDNAASNFVVNETTARGLLLAVDEAGLTVNLTQQFLPSGFSNYSQSQGSVSILDNGNFFIGWGSNPWVNEFDPNGTAIFSARYGPADAPGDGQVAVQSYRAIKVFDWVGRPSTPPALAVKNSSDTVQAFVSWNGDTQTATYSLLGGNQSNITSMTAIQNLNRTGFETTFTLNTTSTTPSFVAVSALDANGTMLGQSGVVQVSSGALIANGSVNNTVSNGTNSNSNSSSSGSPGGTGGASTLPPYTLFGWTPVFAIIVGFLGLL